MKYCLDANALIAPWESLYPPDVFPSLWNAIVNNRNSLIIIQPIFDQIEPISAKALAELTAEKRQKRYALRDWVENSQLQIMDVDVNADAKVHKRSLRWEKKYATSDIGPGADKIDVLLMAYAKTYKHCVVTYESKQPEIPEHKNRYKIPLICQLEKVQCITFVQLLRNLNISI